VTETAAEPGAARRARARYATFYAGGMMFGIDVQRVQEVVRHQTITPVPLAPPEVRGLMNLRGQLVTAIDTRIRLGMEPAPRDRDQVSVVIRTEGGAASLLADEAGDVMEAGEDSFEPPPDNLPARQRDLLEGIHKLDGNLLLILSPDRVLDRGLDGKHR